MRVLTFTRLWPNSVQPNHGIFVEERMRRVAQIPGCSVRVVAPVPYFPRIPGPRRWARYAGVPLHELRHGIVVEHPRYLVVPGIGYSLQGASLLGACLPRLARLRRASAFDVLDAHFLYPDGFAAVEAGRRLDVPVVLSARGSDANSAPDLRGIGSRIGRAVRGATMLIAVSRALADKLVALGADPACVAVVPNGIDADTFRPQPHPAAALRKRLALGTQEALLLAVGRLEVVKGHDLLVEALRRAKEQGGIPQFRLVVLGEGSRKKSLERQVRAAGLAGHVTFAGSVPHEELPSWYSAADLFCLPSRSEGHPNALLEALACGTPAVAAGVGAVPEVLPPTAGVVVEPNHPAPLCHGIRVALSRGSWNAAEVRAAVADRTWQHVASQVVDVFREARDRHRAGTAVPVPGTWSTEGKTEQATGRTGGSG